MNASLFVMPVALFFASFSFWALWAPAHFARIVGLDAASPMGRNEVRAVYGGFGIAMIALCILAFSQWSAHRTGLLLALALAVGGMALGRAGAVLLSRRLPPMAAFALAAESGSVALLLAAVSQES